MPQNNEAPSQIRLKFLFHECLGLWVFCFVNFWRHLSVYLFNPKNVLHSLVRWGEKKTLYTQYPICHNKVETEFEKLNLSYIYQGESEIPGPVLRCLSLIFQKFLHLNWNPHVVSLADWTQLGESSTAERQDCVSSQIWARPQKENYFLKAPKSIHT